MPATAIDRRLVDKLNVYPLIVTGQIVVGPAAPDTRRSERKPDAPPHQQKRPFVRLHHSSTFGRSR